METVTVLSQRRNKAVAREAGKEILKNPAFRCVHIDEELQEESWRIFQETENKNISFVDCSTIAIMRSEGITKLLTFDKEFKTLQKHYRFLFTGSPVVETASVEISQFPARIERCKQSWR